MQIYINDQSLRPIYHSPNLSQTYLMNADFEETGFPAQDSAPIFCDPFESLANVYGISRQVSAINPGLIYMEQR